MKIAIVISKNTSIVSAMKDELSKRGADVRVIFPENELIDLAKFRIEDNLYVIKSVGHLGLGLAGALHKAGAQLLNPYPAIAIIKNKVAVNQVLGSADIPIPETFTTTDPSSLSALLKQYPLIAKPFDGNRGKGIQILRTDDELMSAEFGEFLMVQRYCEPDEPNTFIKAYYLDGQIFLRKRRWPGSGPRDKEGELFRTTRALTEIVARCADALSIKLFGLDIVVSRGSPYIVDVQEFGSFSGVPDAPLLLADFIIKQARPVSSSGSVLPFRRGVSST